jgi:hypothetical protein
LRTDRWHMDCTDAHNLSLIRTRCPPHDLCHIEMRISAQAGAGRPQAWRMRASNAKPATSFRHTVLRNSDPQSNGNRGASCRAATHQTHSLNGPELPARGRTCRTSQCGESHDPSRARRWIGSSLYRPVSSGGSRMSAEGTKAVALAIGEQ